MRPGYDVRRQVLTKVEVTKKMMFVIGGPGQYNRAKKKKGKQTPHTAAKPNGLPSPLPQEIYLEAKNIMPCTMYNEEGIIHHMTIPIIPPRKVLMTRATQPKLVSPRKRAKVS